MNKYARFSEDQLNTLIKIMFVNENSRFYDVVFTLCEICSKKDADIRAIYNTLKSGGLENLMEVTVDSILNNIYMHLDNNERINASLPDFKYKMQLDETVGMFYNIREMALSPDFSDIKAFQKTLDISKQELEGFFKTISWGNMDAFLKLCQSGVIDTPDIAERLGKFSILWNPRYDVVVWGTELLALNPTAELLEIASRGLEQYISHFPLLEHINGEKFRDTLSKIDSDLAREFESKFSKYKPLFNSNRVVSLYLDLQAIETHRARNGIDEFSTLLGTTIKTFAIAQEQNISIFKDFICNKTYVRNVELTIGNLSGKTTNMLNSHLEFSCQADEDFHYKEKVIHSFFNELVKLPSKAPSEEIIDVMHKTLLFHEIERELPINNIKRTNNKI